MSNIIKQDVSEALVENYLPFAGYVIQTRSLPDARDGLKTGARYILYAQYKDKITYDKPFKKGVNTVSSAMHFSPHGDASIYGTAVRMAKPFAMRYPLVEAHGNVGNYAYGDNHAAARYLELRSGKIANEMTCLLKKDTVDVWKLNYTQEENYPTVLPTKFPNILVNGNTGIGVGCASSIPQFNLREVVKKLKYALIHPSASFEELYCPIDFATGGIIINEDEVKESLKNGKGKSAIVRAKIVYDEDKNELVVTELPYQVFTNTICGQLQKGIDEKKIVGVESFFDGEDFDGLKFVIKLTKNANPKLVSEMLYKETSLQSYFSINMMALDNGVIPKVFSWTELVYNYLSYLKEIIRKSYEFDLRKLEDRIHILTGYQIALINIDAVVKIIKESKNAAEAISLLNRDFNFTEVQAKAILDLKLNRLVNMERLKIEAELEESKEKAEDIRDILTNESRFTSIINDELDLIDKKYGDARRTQNMNLVTTDTIDEPIEVKNLICYLTDKNNLILKETDFVVSQKRGGKGIKVGLKNENVVESLTCENSEKIILFSSAGKFYSLDLKNLPINEPIFMGSLLKLEIGETIDKVISLKNLTQFKYLMIITKNGTIKKSPITEYSVRRGNTGSVAIKLRENDSVAAVIPMEEEKIVILTKDGKGVKIDTDDITPVSKNSYGIKGIKLDLNDEVIFADYIKEDREKILLSISKNGLIASTKISDIPTTNRNTKGVYIQKLEANDAIAAGFIHNYGTNDELYIQSKYAVTKIPVSEIITHHRNQKGVYAMSLRENDNIIKIMKNIN